MPRRARIGPIAVALVAFATVGPTPLLAQSSPAPLNLSVATGPALPLGRAAERWAQAIGASGARIEVNVHPGATLAARDPAREFLALQEGRADLAVGSALQWSVQVPALAVFALPWLAPNDAELQALTNDPALRQALEARLASAGVTLVALAPLGYREIATVSRAVRAPEDVKGLRIRTTPSPLIQELLLALGALPQSMSFKDAQAAFAQRTLDGQEGPPSAFAAARAGAAGYRYLTDWGAVADAMLFAVRTPSWQALDGPQRDALRTTALAAIAEAAALSRDAAAVKQLAQNGVAVVRITPAGHAAFRAAVATVDARWREAIGGEIVAIAERAVKRAAVEPSK